MIKHIVMFRLEGEGKDRAAAQFKKAIEALPASVPQLKSVEVGIDLGHISGNWDIVSSMPHAPMKPTSPLTPHTPTISPV